MVDFIDPNGPINPAGPYREGMNNTIFIIPGILIAVLMGFFMYKLVHSLRSRSIAREEKKKLKQQKREKEMAKKVKRN